MKFFRFLMPVLCLVIISCGESSTSKTAIDHADLVVTEPAKLPEPVKIKTAAAIDSGEYYNETKFNQASPVGDWDKKIIKKANIEAECSDYAIFNRKLHAMVKQYGGWIASETETQDNGYYNNSLQVKVPVIQFEDMVNAISNSDAKLLKKIITSEDVTEAVVDAKGRVAVKKAMRDKYLDKLKQTSKMDDILMVEDKIDAIHGEIEMSATRVDFLQHEAAYSTININFHPPVAATIQEDGPGIGKRILIAAAGGGVWVGDMLIGLISIWPILLLGFIVFYFARKKWNSAVVIKTKQ